MVTDFFEFNGKSSEDFFLKILGKTVYGMPKKKIIKESIPGRDGDIIIEQDSYENISIGYEIGLEAPVKSIGSRTRKLKAWLNNFNGYCILTDSYNRGFYRKAVFCNGFDIDELIEGAVDKANIVFDCQPYLYSNSGNKLTVLSQSGLTIINPYKFTALPMIGIYGYGNFTLTVNKEKFNFTNLTTGYIKVDSENISCYYGRNNLNHIMSSYYGNFPILQPGKNKIEWTVNDSDSEITQVEIVPNWRCL